MNLYLFNNCPIMLVRGQFVVKVCVTTKMPMAKKNKVFAQYFVPFKTKKIFKISGSASSDDYQPMLSYI
ncbi:hypothetical protein BpHYR1_008279 [Brachionus plicatilis]|uniref:Uncharacterized protein n=1 Tax=Brachionus plicatilis TaxID=10195 RepID=A0A3M7Q146_BRAPC|nr:hypothetical protein BpHYR1_008279 [Brachionus plicatilis]